MNKALDILAKIVSVAAYPLFIPTYGISLFCYTYKAFFNPQMPVVWMIVAILGTFLLTCAIPLGSIAIMLAQGKVKDLQITDARERTVPYLISCIGFGCWSYFLISILHAPAYLCYVAVGATAALVLVSFINLWWKISAHLTGMGGLFGGIMTFCLGVGAIPTWSTVGLWTGLTLLVVFARLRLNAHTSEQVCAGWLLGVFSTFIPYSIAFYAA